MAPKTLEFRAEEQARGGFPTRGRRFVDGEFYERGLIDELRLRAYYPPTREFKELTPFVLGLSYVDDEATAAVNGSLQLDNHDGTVARYMNRPGMILMFETAADVTGRRFRERQRWVAWETQFTDLAQGTGSVQFYDHLIYLQSLSGDWHYTKDKKHPRGWTAHEMAAHACRRAKVPVAGLVKTRQRFKYVVLKQHSLYDLIVKAYQLDSKRTGRHYYVVSERGKVRVRRSRKRSAILAVEQGANLRSGSFGRSLPENFANTVIPRGGDPDESTGKRRRAGSKAAKAEDSPRAKKQSKSERKRKEKSEEKRIATTMLFGSLAYSPKHSTINDRDYTTQAAKALSNRLARAEKSLTLEVDGNILIEQGDRIYVRMNVTNGAPIRREVVVSSVTQTIGPGEHSMSLVCKWREKEANPVLVQGKELELEAKDTDTDSAVSGGNYAKGSKMSQGEIENLARQVGFPNPEMTAAVAMAESGGDSGIYNGICCYGLMQIHAQAHREDPDKLKDPEYNMRVALRIFKAAGNTFARDWGVVQTGAYRKYL